MAASNGEGPAAAAGRNPPVLVFDVMDTVVKDPFYTHMAQFFGLTFKELLASKHPTAWCEFESGQLSEEQFYATFWKEGGGRSPCDGPGLVQHMVSAYEYVEGMDELLQRLQRAGGHGGLHVCSNYPMWYRYIDEKLQLSRYMDWTFISCEGPMKGLRKPSSECYQVMLETLRVPPNDIIFVDDREANVEAALAAGMQGIHFKGAAPLEEELRRRGVLLG